VDDTGGDVAAADAACARATMTAAFSPTISSNNNEEIFYAEFMCSLELTRGTKETTEIGTF
jgi:hypothetical protein